MPLSAVGFSLKKYEEKVRSQVLFFCSTELNLIGRSITRTGKVMHEEHLPTNLAKRIEELQGREVSYWEDELFSPEALTNLTYRQMLEKNLQLDPLGPLPPR
jgi:hypothetical protein